MLVLTRKPSERIVIDGNIIITIVQINMNQVRIGIDAPPAVHIRREEVIPRQAVTSTATKQLAVE